MGALGALRADVDHAGLDVLGHRRERFAQVLERPGRRNGGRRHLGDGGRAARLLLRRRAVRQIEQPGEEQPQGERQGHQPPELEPVQRSSGHRAVLRWDVGVRVLPSAILIVPPCRATCVRCAGRSLARPAPSHGASLAPTGMFKAYGRDSKGGYRRPFPGRPAGRAGDAPEPRDAPGAGVGRGGPGEPQRRRAARGDPPHPPHGQEGMAGGVAAARRHPDGSHHPLRATTRPAGSAGCAPRRAGRSAPTCSRRWAPSSSRSGSRAVCVYHAFVETAVEALEGSGIPVAAVSTGFPGGTLALRAADRGDPRVGRRRRRGDRHRDHPRPRAHRELARALRRGARHARGLRRRAHQDHPRHRRAGHAAQRGAREPGLHDGRRRLHQDLDRQGERQRHAPGRAGDGARDPRLPRAHRSPGRASSRPAGSAPPRTRSTGWR